MAATNEDSGTAWTPPYIAWKTLLNLIERLETDMPPQIDKTFLKGSNQLNAQTMNALKSLGLVGDDGTVTQSLIDLVDAGVNRPKVVGEMLGRFYAEPVRLGTVNATPKQLDDAFALYGVSGSTLRKAVSFFIKAATYAEVPLSPHFKTPARSTSVPRRRRPRVPANNNAAEMPADRATNAGANTNVDGLRARYIEMLMKKAEAQTDQMDEELLNRIERLLDLPTTEE
jgi:hypothetical protein